MTRASAAPPERLASAILDATLIVVEAPRSLLQAHADKVGATLPGASDGDDLYPVLLEFWNVSDGTMRPFGIENDAWLALMSAAWGPGGQLGRRAFAASSAWATRRFGVYHEFLCGIPDVQVAGLNEPALLVLRMYTDSPFARIVDKALGYGFGKQAAQFGVSPQETRVFSHSGNTIATFRTDTAAKDSEQHQALRPRVDTWLKRQFVGIDAGSRAVASTMSRQKLDELTPVHAELRLGQPLHSLLGAASRSQHGAASAAVAFKQRCRVEISAPRPVHTGQQARHGVRP